MKNRITHSRPSGSATPNRVKHDQKTAPASKLVTVQETPNTGISRERISSFLLKKPTFPEVMQFVEVEARKLAAERMHKIRT